jgi:hypothetical protein
MLSLREGKKEQGTSEEVQGATGSKGMSSRWCNIRDDKWMNTYREREMKVKLWM